MFGIHVFFFDILLVIILSHSGVVFPLVGTVLTGPAVFTRMLEIVDTSHTQ